MVPFAGDDWSCSFPVQVTVALELPPTCTNAAYTLRKNYYRWLYAFECHDVHNITLSNEEVLPVAFGVMLPGPCVRPIVVCNKSHACVREPCSRALCYADPAPWHCVCGVYLASAR